MSKLTSSIASLVTLLVLHPATVFAQQDSVAPGAGTVLSRPLMQQSTVPAAAQRAEDDVEDAVRRYRIGVSGGIALDPELINFGAHGAFGPLFVREIEFRPGVEFGLGEVTTLFGVNLDVIYLLPGTTRTTRWTPYVGAGPNFALRHEDFEVDDSDDLDNRFDFSDTDFTGGFNFIAGVRGQGGKFFEMKATAWGVSMVRLVAGFNF